MFLCIHCDVDELRGKDMPRRLYIGLYSSPGTLEGGVCSTLLPPGGTSNSPNSCSASDAIPTQLTRYISQNSFAKLLTLQTPGPLLFRSFSKSPYPAVPSSSSTPLQAGECTLHAGMHERELQGECRLVRLYPPPLRRLER